MSVEAPEADETTRPGTAATAGPDVAGLVTDVVEGRAERRPAPGVDWSSRAFVTAVEGPRERGRTSAERPRAGILIAAALLSLAVVAAMVAGPAVLTGIRHTGRPAGTGGARTSQAQAPTAARPGAANPQGGGSANPVAPLTEGGQGSGPGPGAAPAGGPVLQPQTSQPPGDQTPAAQPQAAPPPSAPRSQAAQQPAQPQGSPPGSAIVGGSQAGSGWQYHNGGGNSGCDTCFGGWIAWVNGPTSATATWGTNVTSDTVHVAVWVPNTMAGAVVSYTVTGARQYGPFQIMQERVSGWQTLSDGAGQPATFASNGHITVVMHWVAVGSPPPGKTDPACLNGGTYCSAMAAAQVKFWWG